MCLRLENSGRLTCNPGEYFTSIMGHRVDCNHVINSNFAGSFRFFVSIRQDVNPSQMKFRLAGDCFPCGNFIENYLSFIKLNFCSKAKGQTTQRRKIEEGIISNF